MLSKQASFFSASYWFIVKCKFATSLGKKSFDLLYPINNINVELAGTGIRITVNHIFARKTKSVYGIKVVLVYLQGV